MNNERDIKPENRRTSIADPRIVYGARCVWWDSIGQARTTPSGLPCCPHCGSVLFEVESEPVWWTNVDAYAERTGDADYRAFMVWLRGKCFPSIDVARLEFKLDALVKKFAEPRGEPGRWR